MRICSQATHVQTFDHAQQNTIPLYDSILLFLRMLLTLLALTGRFFSINLAIG